MDWHLVCIHFFDCIYGCFGIIKVHFVGCKVSGCGILTNKTRETREARERNLS